jgi:sortase A
MARDGGGRRRWTLWVGVACILVGATLLGYVGWQYWGTNLVSHRKHDRIVEEVQKQWRTDERPTLTTKGTPVVEVPEGDVVALIRIPEFGDDYVVPVLEGTGDEVLAAGFGHFEDTADPGQVGNFAIAAHRVTHGEPLHDMPSLDIGDEIAVETRTATYTYRLTSGGDDLRVTFRDGWVAENPLPRNPDPDGVQPKRVKRQRLITLTTCAELFHTDDRLVAFGILDHKEEK